MPSHALYIGKMYDTSKVIPPSPLLYRHLQMSLTQALDQSLQNYDTVLTLSQDSREVVGHAHAQLEWEDPYQEGGGSDNRVRCITDRMGSSMSGAEDRRSLDKSRSPGAHQLPGASGSHICSCIHLPQQCCHWLQGLGKDPWR